MCLSLDIGVCFAMPEGGAVAHLDYCTCRDFGKLGFQWSGGGGAWEKGSIDRTIHQLL